MTEQRITPPDSASPSPTRFMRLVYWLVGLRLMSRLRYSFTNWRLIPFIFYRTSIGRRLRQGGAKLKFYGSRFAYSQGEQSRAARLGSLATWQVVKFAVMPLVFAALAVAVFVGFPTAYQQLATSKAWPALSLPSLTAESYVGIMSTAAQATATMLALFFTAVSVVTSTTYAKVTTQIRLLIAQDDLNRRYLRLLGHTAATAMAGIGLHAAGIPASSVLAGYVLILSSICLLAFLPLGIRTFALFDPSNLTGYPIRTFVRAVTIVTYTGRRWLDPSFQNHANAIGKTQLRILSDLLVFGMAENRPRHDTVLDIAKTVNHLARIYIAKKPAIPSDSFWFTRKPEFKRWEVTSSSMTDITLRAGVAPAPDVVPNHGFVETQCTEITVQSLKHLFERAALDDVTNLLLAVNKTAMAYAQQFEQEESIQLVEAARAVVLEGLRAAAATAEPLKYLQIVDVLGMAALAPILTAGLALTERPVGELLGVAGQLLELNRRGLYAQPHPRKVLESIEDLFHRLEFERAAEGGIKTQLWYVQQIIALAYAEVIRDVIRRIVTTVNNEFVSPTAELVTTKQALFAGVWFQRAVEACHKAKGRVEGLEARYAELKRFHVTKIQWYPSGADNALLAIEAARVKIVRLLAEIVPELCVVPSGGELPDLLGQVRAWLAEELVAMMVRKQEEGFPELFLAYFNASLSVQRHFITLAQQPEKQDYLRVAMDAILDVMDMSGLAFLFSELDGTAFSKFVGGTWDLYFDQAADKPAAVRMLYTAIDSKLTLPLFSSSAMQRQQWGLQLVATMEERGIDPNRRIDQFLTRERPKPHSSTVIESVLMGYRHPIDNPHEYFGALYIALLKEAKGIDLPQSVANCIDSIERARKRQAEFKDETTN
jgi:hypothetical protein